jgi:hypothetical protein
MAIQTQLLPFLNLPVSEVQETSDWRTHDWNVMSEQRKSNWRFGGKADTKVKGQNVRF